MQDAIILAASAVINGLMCLGDLVWYVQEQTTLETFSSKDSAWSSVTPSNFTASEKCTEEPATVIQ